MSFTVLGLNHRTAPLDLREKLALEKEQLVPCLERLEQFVDQGVILSTCNRLEVYTLGPHPAALGRRLAEFLVAYSGVAGKYQEPHLYQYQDGECVLHLFRVAGGLDSMVVGERQILGQVRTAYSVASEQGVRGPLSRLFHQALRVGRRIQHETNLGGGSRSVSRAGVQLVRRILGNLDQRRALVIGAGDAGCLVAQALADAGVKEMAVVNRTQWRGDALARKLGGVAVSFDELPQQLIEADVVISSTGSPGYVLDWAVVNEAIPYRRGRPLIMMDIAVPRDIDPAVGELDEVELYDIEALQLVSELGCMPGEIAQAEAIAVSEAEEFLRWWHSLAAVPVISAIRVQAEEIRQAELSKTLQKLKGQGLSYPPEQGFEQLSIKLEAMTSALVKKLLHNPTIYLREGRDPSRQQMAREFFNLDDEGERSGRR